MSTIKFNQLEIARKNPTAFAESLSSGKGSSYGKSKYLTWQNAIHECHKHREDLSRAINYFENSFTKQFVNNAKNNAEKDQWIAEIDAYVKSHKKLKLVHIESRIRISASVIGTITVGGQIPIINMNGRGGYSVVLFKRDETPWGDELRFPLIQYYVATNLYNVDPSEVEVGVYAIDQQKHERRNYSATEIDTALKEMKKIGRAVIKVL